MVTIFQKVFDKEHVELIVQQMNLYVLQYIQVWREFMDVI
jgi:hypothetical protein